MRDLLWRSGHGPLFPVEVGIANEPSGRPVAAAGERDVRISIAHKDDVAVALASETGDVGIDVERVEARADSFAEVAFTASELRLVERRAARRGVDAPLGREGGRGEGGGDGARRRASPVPGARSRGQPPARRRSVGGHEAPRRLRHRVDTNMRDPVESDVLDEVARIIREVIGEEWAEDVPIEMHTSFAQDLELESIEFVALAERLKTRYGRTVDFAGWLGSMELDQILALRVGQLVEFIVRCITERATA